MKYTLHEKSIHNIRDLVFAESKSKGLNPTHIVLHHTAKDFLFFNDGLSTNSMDGTATLDGMVIIFDHINVEKNEIILLNDMSNVS